jgi:3-deoxy-7-phosphoheptulonate synthase
MDTNISDYAPLPSPNYLKNKLILPNKLYEFVKITRNKIKNILDKKDKRKLIIIGPCSIHDYNVALDYAKFLKSQRDKYNDKIEIVMRTYFSKPRTSIGWKGFVYDPYLNNTNSIESGLTLARELLIKILEIGVPCTMEHVDTIIPQYFDDVLCWAAIGARTSESQIHRELASGISTPIGFKNNTEGNIDVAVNAIQSANNQHCFLGCVSDGKISMISTKGNPYCHIILRGGKNNPNYYEEDVKTTIQKLSEKKLMTSIIIDCSHGNSNKQHKNQLNVCKNICEQMKTNPDIVGIMVESNLVEGNQKITDNPLVYGKSVTDSCINLVDSEKVFMDLSNI